MEPGKALCDHSWLFTLSVQSLVKLLTIGMEPRVRSVIHQGHQCSKPSLTGETRFHCEYGCILGMRTAAPRGGKQTVDPLDQWDCVLEWNCRASTISKFLVPRLHIYATLYSIVCDFNSSLLTFFKGTVAWDSCLFYLAYLYWSMQTITRLLKYFKRAALYCFAFQ